MRIPQLLARSSTKVSSIAFGAKKPPNLATSHFPNFKASSSKMGTSALSKEASQSSDATSSETTSTGHDVSEANVASEQAVDSEFEAFQEHQSTAARLSLAEEARTLADVGTWGLISTLGTGENEGYPAGSIVEYATDEQGRLLFAFSSMSSHTRDVKTHKKASLTIPSPGFQGLEDARVNLTGDIEQVSKDEDPQIRDLYKKKHPNSFWIDFGDFSLFRLTPRQGRLIGGFARAGKVSGEEYSSASPDPVFKFSGPVAGHMNADHSDATLAIVQDVAKIKVDKANILTLDRLGMAVRCEQKGESFRARIPFSRPAEDRKAVKEVIVEMTKAAMQARSK